MAKRKEGGQPGNKNAEKWTEPIALKLAEDLIDWLKEDANVFFEKFLYIERDLHPDSTSYLTGKFESFSEQIKKAKKIQELKIVDLGISDKTATTMSIFCLKNNHGYADKKEVKHDGGINVSGFNYVKPDGPDNKTNV